MPFVTLPGGAKLHWEQRGEGPSVVVAQQFFAPTSVFAGLLDLLARNHRVVTYDPRGIGQSTRQGPRDWRVPLMWISAALSIVIAVGTVLEESKDSEERESGR